MIHMRGESLGVNECREVTALSLVEAKASDVQFQLRKCGELEGCKELDAAVEGDVNSNQVLQR